MFLYMEFGIRNLIFFVFNIFNDRWIKFADSNTKKISFFLPKKRSLIHTSTGSIVHENECQVNEGLP